MAAGRMNKVLIVVSLASIAVTVIGFALGYHLMALFLFFPGIFGLGMTRGSVKSRRTSTSTKANGPNSWNLPMRIRREI